MSSQDSTLLVLELLVVLFLAVFYFLFQEIPQMMEHRWDYLDSNYNRIDLFIYAVFFTIIGLHIRCVVLASQINWFADAEFVNVSLLSTLLQWRTNLIALLVFVCWLKMLEYLSAFKKISRLVIIIDMMVRELVDFLILLVICVGAFASGEFIAYGYKSDDSYTWIYSFIIRISDMFVGADFDGAQSLDRIVGAFFSILFALTMSLLLLNLVIAILTSAYEMAQDEIGSSYWCERQYEMILEHQPSFAVLRLADNTLFWAYDASSYVLHSVTRLGSACSCCRQEPRKPKRLVIQ